MCLLPLCVPHLQYLSYFLKGTCVFTHKLRMFALLAEGFQEG